MKKFLAILLAALMLLSLAACGSNNATDGNATDGNVSAGDAAAGDEIQTLPQEGAVETGPFFSDFSTVSLDGEEYTQEIFEGNKLTMVNIWGTFCAPCINEMPYLEKLSKDYADKGLVIVGIVCDTYDYMAKENSEAKIEKAEQIVADTGVSYVNLLPSDSLNTAKLDYITTFPTTYFLNEKGEIVASEYIGSRSYEQWADIIDSLL